VVCPKIVFSLTFQNMDVDVIFIYPVQQGTFTESQNHRTLGVGRDLCGSSSPTPLPKQGHPEQAAQDVVQAGLEYLQRRTLHSLPGQPVTIM